LEQRERETELGFHPGILYDAWARASSWLRSRRRRQREGEAGHGVSLASRREEDEDEFLRFIFLPKGYGGLVGPCWAEKVGFWWAVVLGCGGLAGKPLFSLIFCLFIFCFLFH
jgi:hypothetical protein